MDYAEVFSDTLDARTGFRIRPNFGPHGTMFNFLPKRLFVSPTITAR
jgi:hypothetical protein